MSDDPSSKPSSPFFGMVRKLDDAFYAFEGLVVTVFVALMTLMVSADVLQRRVADPKSKVGALAARMLGIEDPNTLAFFEETGGNVFVIVALLVLIVFGIYSAEKNRERRGEGFERTRVITSSALAALIMGALAYIVGNPDVPSRILFAGTFGITGVVVVAQAIKKKPEGWLLISAGATIAAAALVAIALRFIPEGYTWSKKISLLLLMWVAFLGASMCAHDGKHLRLEALARLVPPRIAPYVEATGALVTVLVCTFFAWLVGVEIFDPENGIRAMGELVEMTEIPSWIRIFSAVVGFGILGLRYLGVAGSAVMGGTYGRPKSELEEVLESAEVKP